MVALLGRKDQVPSVSLQYIYIYIINIYIYIHTSRRTHTLAQGVQRPELRRPFKHGGFLRPFYGVFTAFLRAFYGVSTAVDKRPKLLRREALGGLLNNGGLSTLYPRKVATLLPLHSQDTTSKYAVAGCYRETNHLSVFGE